MQRRSLPCAWSMLPALCAILSALQIPAYAMPEFARKYGVGCTTCHTVAPQLNSFGQAFKANHFNWPDTIPIVRGRGLKAVPLSGLGTFTYASNPVMGMDPINFNQLNLDSADGVKLGQHSAGGYFIKWFAASRDPSLRAGTLGDAYAALPILGHGGKVALIAGQFSKLNYQWDAVNSLTAHVPVALGAAVNGFSFAAPGPAVRLDFFDHRQQGTANGTYVSLSVPFAGNISLNRMSRVGGANGVALHAFKRMAGCSAGVFGYAHNSASEGGVLLTRDLTSNVRVLGAAALGHGAGGDVRALTLETEYAMGGRLALTGRFDLSRMPGAASGGGSYGGYAIPTTPGPEATDVGGVFAVTYYPFKIAALRLTAEVVQHRGDRGVTVYARAQF